MLSHYRSCESQLRRLSQLPPTRSMIQTRNDLGFSGGYLSRGRWSQFAWSYGTDVYSWRPARETSNFSTVLKFSQMSTQWANPALEEIKIGMTRSATGQDWNCVDRLMDWTGRGGRMTKAGWHISRLPESELFSSPDESTVPAVQCSPETQSLLQAKAGLQQNCHMDYPGTFQISPPSTRPFHSGLSPQLCHNSSL